MKKLLRTCSYSLPLFAMLLAAGTSVKAQPAVAGHFVQTPLPYALDALEPYISSETMTYHYGKHYKAYVDNLNKLATASEAAKSLEQVIMAAPPGPLLNNAAQAWNHAFFFNGLKPGGGGEPAGQLAEAITRDFGSFAKFREVFVTAAQGLFGSGWAWLVVEKGKLKVVQTSNADLPMKHGQTALFGLDVWEHAYYLDYRNARPKYIDAVFDHLINWDLVSTKYAATRLLAIPARK